MRIPDNYDASEQTLSQMGTTDSSTALIIGEMQNKLQFLAELNYWPECPEDAYFCYFCIITIRYH